MLLERELPLGWQRQVLRDLLCDIQSGSRPKGGVREITKGIPSLGGEHLNPFGGFDFRKVRFVSEEFFRRMRRGIIEPNDVLVVKDGATTGKVSFVGSDFPFPQAVINEHLFVLRSRPDILEPKYLFWFLFSAEGQTQIRANFRGSAQGGINQSIVDNVWLSFPALDEQRRIVARIEGLFDRIAEARRLRVAAEDDAERLLDAAVKEAMAAFPSTRIPLVKILSEKPRNGWSPKGDNDTAGVPVLKLGAVLRFRYDPTAVKFTQEPTREDAHYWLRPGDILISRSNTPHLVGHAAIYDGNPHPCIYPDLLMRMRVREDLAEPRFLIFWLRSPETRCYIRQRARGASSTMKKISQGDVSEIPFPQVPLSEQRRIVDYLDGVQAQVAELKCLQAASAAELERLSGAVLARAFRGEL